MTDALASEWVKLHSVRSTHTVLAVIAATILGAAGLAWYAVTLWDDLPVERRSAFGLASLAELTAWVTQLCLAVLGVLAITSEYASGEIRSSFTVLPRRHVLFTAKAAVVAGVALVVGQAATFATFFAGRLVIGGRPIRGHTEPLSEQLPVLLASGLSVMVFALVGLGLGAVLRSTAGAITAVVSLWFVLPTLVRQLPTPWNDRINSFMLHNLARQLAGAGHEGVADAGVLTPLEAFAVVSAYLLVALGTAAVVIRRRDV